MAEKLMTDGSMALREKQYRVITIEATEKPQNAKLRVAVYARVSSASDDQLNSFAAQNRHYSDLISSKENWRMVDIYADEGRVHLPTIPCGCYLQHLGRGASRTVNSL